MNNKSLNILMTLGLLWGMGKAWQEISTVLYTDQNWGRLLSSEGIFTISVYSLLFIAGLWFFFIGLWRVETLNRSARKRKAAYPRAGWLVISGFIPLFAYMYLFSAWQFVLAQPWMQFIFAIGFSQLVLFLASPDREQRFGWDELALTLCLFVYPRVVQEARLLAADASVHRIVTVAGFLVIAAIIFSLYSTYSERIRSTLVTWREKMGAARFVIAALLCLAPILHRYLVQPEIYIVYDDIRFAVLLASAWGAAYVGLAGSALVTREAFGVNLGVLLFTSLLAQFSFNVTDYPFSLSWSEGNRFYDYSLVFGQSLYEYAGKIINPYDSPGRYGLWGVLFLWEGLPIWAHRLWNLILLTAPVLIFATLLTRQLTPRHLRYGVLLWITLFLTFQAPLHPPFIVVSIFTILFAFDDSFARRGASLAVAGFYAGLSRWTWAFAPAAIGALIDLLLYYPKRTDPLWRRLAPTMGLILLGLIPGLLPTAGSYISLAQGESLTSNQPLLWYRLFPNDVLGLGVLFLALLFTLPLILVFVWWVATRQLQLDWVQKTAVFGSLTGFFVIGLVISAKIGGGGDLHNMDMYIITLLVTVLLGMTMATRDRVIPAWVLGLAFYLAYMMVYPFTPFNPGSTYSPRLDRANENQVNEALSNVQKRVKSSAQKGEVLFMDNRQLLTFGFVEGIPFVPEYEKKYMMDQAMGANAEYFQPYYDDLANKRFVLIVTEPLRTTLKEEMGGAFSEENDAWVTWVSNPTLCFYRPIYESKKVNIQLLVPKQNTIGCEEYLQ